MASTFSANKNLESPGHGDLVDTWDSPVNRNWVTLDTVMGGTTNLNATGVSGNVTLSVAQYQPSYLVVAGTMSANITYVIPSGVGGKWVVANYTTGNFVLRFASGYAGTGGGATVTVPTNARTEILSDGFNIVLAVNTSTPSGPNGAIQQNVAGFFFGSGNLTSDGSSLMATGSVSCTYTLAASYLSLTAGPGGGNAAIAGNVSAGSLNVSGGVGFNSSIGIGNAGLGEVDLFFRTGYGTIYPYCTSGGTWGVYDATNPRIRFSTSPAGDLNVSGNLSATHTYAAGNSQGSNTLALSAAYFSYNNNASYYATTGGDYNYIFHAGDGWRQQYQRSTGSWWWVDYASRINMSLDGGANFGIRGSANIAGNIATPNAVTAGYMHSTGSQNVDGTMQAGTVNSSNNVNCGWDCHVGNVVYAQALQTWDWVQVNGHLGVNGNFDIANNIYVNNGSISVRWDCNVSTNLRVYNEFLMPNAQDTHMYSGGGGVVIGVAGWPYVFTNAAYAWNYGGWIVNSARESKKDLVPIAGALALTLAITGYDYTDIASGQRKMGVVAEEIEAILPQATRRLDGNNIDKPVSVGVDQGGLVSALFPQVTKELVALITEQSAKIAALEARLHAAGL